MTELGRIEGGVETPMRDGVRLRGDLWRPPSPSPAVVFRTPYGRRQISSDTLHPQHCLAGGFAALVQDTRGRFDSGGEWRAVMWEQEAEDTYDTVEWAAAQPWCDGNVFLAGTSYLGIVAWLGAALRPPHLRGIAAAMTTGAVADVHDTGGALRLDHLVGWLAYMAADWLGRQGPDADPALVAKVAALIHDPERAMLRLPLADMPELDLPGFPIRVGDLLDGRVRALPDWDHAAVEVPVLSVTGWYDVYATATIRGHLEMRRLRPDLRHELIVGPWAHTGALTHLQGEVNFGVAASAAAARLPAQHLGFFRRCVDGPDESAPVRYFLMGADKWHAAERWPADAAGHVLHLTGPAVPGGPPGRLTAAPGTAAPDGYVHDPADPVPSRGGRVLHLGRLTPGPLDLGRTATRPDVLLYLGDVLTEDTDVIGRVRLRLTFATEAADADVMARLVDGLPDGRLLPVCEGVVRLSHRDGPDTPVPRGEPVRLEIDLGHTAQRFRTGHRIGLMLSSSNFPHYDRNQGSGQPAATAEPGTPSTQSVHYGTSVLLLGDVVEP
ncbi:CocE/NonD family hydrolase [Actinomadura viridis]|uniref:CocE/NonD family hydrolase n=1 Tax=Actinomadura viridis TaxID=58110 RepID=A0A931DS83_9ACTN|nr:CocE/NonD family hydrolase [Actinomadura viridis]MBG6091748.1 putative CocE/NonD family hydrolase [Actinomadura viridis]